MSIESARLNFFETGDDGGITMTMIISDCLDSARRFLLPAVLASALTLGSVTGHAQDDRRFSMMDVQLGMSFELPLNPKDITVIFVPATEDRPPTFVKQGGRMWWVVGLDASVPVGEPIYFEAPIRKGEGSFLTRAVRPPPAAGMLTFKALVDIGSEQDDPVKVLAQRDRARALQAFFAGTPANPLKTWKGGQLKVAMRGSEIPLSLHDRFVSRSGSPYLVVCTAECAKSGRRLRQYVEETEGGSAQTEEILQDMRSSAPADGRPQSPPPTQPDNKSRADNLIVRMLAFGSGRVIPDFRARALSDCNARFSSTAPKPSSPDAEGRIVLPLPPRNSDGVCILVSRLRATGEESCFSRSLEDVALHVRGMVPLDLPVEGLDTNFRCPILPRMQVRFVDENKKKIEFTDLKRITGQVKIAGIVLDNEAILSQYPSEVLKDPQRIQIEFERPGWYVPDLPGLQGNDLTIPLRTQFVPASEIVFRLQSSAGVFERNCRPVFRVGVGNLMTIQGNNGSVNPREADFSLNALEQLKGYEVAAGGNSYLIRTSDNAMAVLSTHRDDRVCKFQPGEEAVNAAELRSREIVRRVRNAGAVIVSVLTASNSLKDVSPPTIEDVYGVALEFVNSSLPAVLRDASKQVEGSFAIERHRTSRPDGRDFAEQTPVIGAPLFESGDRLIQFQNSLLYGSPRASGRPTILTQERNLASLDPATLSATVDEYLSKQGFTPSLADKVDVLIGRTPEDGQSACSTWRGLIRSVESDRRRVIMIEFATVKMLERLPADLFEQSSSYVRRCKTIPREFEKSLLVLLVVLPDAINTPARRDQSVQVMTRLASGVFGGSR
jgi:hypothetical protein